ncbi:MAG: hypothetical protein ABW252_23200 [Polyangiales bacterium]
MSLSHRPMVQFTPFSSSIRATALVALLASAGCGASDDAAPRDHGAHADHSPDLPASASQDAPASATASHPAHAEVGAADAADAAGADGHPEGEPAHAAQKHEMCRGPGQPDPRDGQITTGDAAVILQVGSNRDVTLPPQVLDWMKDTQHAEAHDGWHLVRRWDQGCRKSNAPAQGCSAAQRLLNQGLWRADIQQGAPGDGLAFLMAHRHMIEMLKETFPKHAGLFSGFKQIPKTKAHPENPMPWKNISWTQSNQRGFEILENIERNLSMFASEDELGHFIQGSIRWTPQNPSTFVSQTGSGLHGALHGQWTVIGSPIALINQAVDVRNFSFWKLHGWIDDIWERYRVAKGQKRTDADYQKIHYEQCMEMHALEPRNRKGVKPDVSGGTTTGGDPDASGFFAKSVRPLLDATCTGCHSAEGGAAAGLVLGGAGVTTRDIIEGLVGVKATNDEYSLIVPGNPDQSWLFLKASGASERVTCRGACDRQRMPPAGNVLTSAQLATLRQWITNGATLK